MNFPNLPLKLEYLKLEGEAEETYYMNYWPEVIYNMKGDKAFRRKAWVEGNKDHREANLEFIEHNFPLIEKRKERIKQIKMLMDSVDLIQESKNEKF